MVRLAIGLMLVAMPVFAQQIRSARYIEPTEAYGHGALAGGEYAALEVEFSDGSRRSLRWDNAVFEDTRPRLHDFDGDGAPEIVTVVGDMKLGARVQVIAAKDGQLGSYAANAPIGQKYRWLSIAGIADFDGDGVDEIAYVDRPHLAKELVLLSIKNDGAGQGAVTEMRANAALTNHHLGHAEIEGGVRNCPAAAPVILTADGDWSSIIETTYESGRLVSKPVALYAGPESFAPFLLCP